MSRELHSRQAKPSNGIGQDVYQIHPFRVTYRLGLIKISVASYLSKETLYCLQRYYRPHSHHYLCRTQRVKHENLNKRELTWCEIGRIKEQRLC